MPGYQHIRIFAVYKVLYRRLLKTKPKDVDEQSDLNFTWSETPKSGFLGHLLCALGLRCVSNAQRDAKTQGFLIQKRDDPDQNGRMPTHGE